MSSPNPAPRPEPEARGLSPFRDRIAIGALLALFVVLHLPVMVGLTRYHVDEHYYTDAAIRMVRTGDYLTPHFADGTPRFEKPILSYWAIAAAFRVFGVRVWASRLPSLLAVCLTLWFATRIAGVLFRDHAAVWLTAVILFSNNELYGAALRATPDALLALFLTMSALGFAHLFFGERREPWVYFLAYGGAGLGVAAKGFLPPLLVVYCWIFARWSLRFSLRRLIHPPSMAVGALAALGWFAAIFARHGTAALSGFYTDQVGIRVGTTVSRVLSNGVSYLGVLPRDFLPCSLVLVPALLFARSVLGAEIARRRRSYLFVGGWYALLFVLFTAANLFKTRYFFPAYPLVAAALASLIVAAVRDPRVAGWLRRVAGPAYGAVAVLGAAVAVAGLRLDRRIATAGAVWMVAALALYFFTRRRGFHTRALAVGLMLALLVWVYDLQVRPVLSLSPVPRLVACLRAARPTRVLGVGVEARYLSGIRLVSGGLYRPEPVSEVPAALPSGTLLIVSGRRRAAAAAAGYSLRSCGFGYRKVKTPEVLDVLRGGSRDALLERHRKPFYLAEGPNP